MAHLLGRDFTPPDIHAKVTGRAKYAEDFRADGMLFCRLLTSPMPARARPEHRRVRGAQHGGRRRDSDRRRAARRGPRRVIRPSRTSHST